MKITVNNWTKRGFHCKQKGVLKLTCVLMSTVPFAQFAFSISEESYPNRQGWWDMQLQRWRHQTPPTGASIKERPKKKKNLPLRIHPQSCQPAAWPDPDSWCRALEAAVEKQTHAAVLLCSINGGSTRATTDWHTDLWLSGLPPLAFEAVPPFAVEHSDAVEGADN